MALDAGEERQMWTMGRADENWPLRRQLGFKVKIRRKPPLARPPVLYTDLRLEKLAPSLRKWIGV